MPNQDSKINNLQKANLESHRIVEESLKEALFALLEKKYISEITITELVKKAGVSRSVFYKHYYLVKDVLKKDVEDITKQVRQNMSASLYENWLHILNVTLERRDKLILTVVKADMGMDILRCFNSLIKPGDNQERFLAWNGIIFNEILYWAKQGFVQPPEQLAAKLTDLTESLYTKPFKKE